MKAKLNLMRHAGECAGCTGVVQPVLCTWVGRGQGDGRGDQRDGANLLAAAAGRVEGQWALLTLGILMWPWLLGRGLALDGVMCRRAWQPDLRASIVDIKGGGAISVVIDEPAVRRKALMGRACTAWWRSSTRTQLLFAGPGPSSCLHGPHPV